MLTTAIKVGILGLKLVKKAIEGGQLKNARFTDNSDPTWWTNPHYLQPAPS